VPAAGDAVTQLSQKEARLRAVYVALGGSAETLERPQERTELEQRLVPYTRFPRPAEPSSNREPPAPTVATPAPKAATPTKATTTPARRRRPAKKTAAANGSAAATPPSTKTKSGKPRPRARAAPKPAAAKGRAPASGKPQAPPVTAPHETEQPARRSVLGLLRFRRSEPKAEPESETEPGLTESFMRMMF
jgi:translation initiation factor IF-2